MNLSDNGAKIIVSPAAPVALLLTKKYLMHKTLYPPRRDARA